MRTRRRNRSERSDVLGHRLGEAVRERFIERKLPDDGAPGRARCRLAILYTTPRGGGNTTAVTLISL